jgi:hypothetical protein
LLFEESYGRERLTTKLSLSINVTKADADFVSAGLLIFTAVIVKFKTSNGLNVLAG